MQTMANIEERLQAIEREHRTLEQEHNQLKKTIELQTIAIGALVNKAALEKLNEKYDKIFDTLITHDRFTNEQFAELRNQQTELDGKIVGLQTEMRQHFEKIETTMATKEESGAMENRINENISTLKNQMLDAFKQLITTVETRLPPAQS
jgi:chromosome segregation ATPase